MYRLDQETLLEARQEALEEGREEGKIEIAKSMLKNGESIEKIMKYTGLLKEDIDNL